MRWCPKKRSPAAGVYIGALFIVNNSIGLITPPVGQTVLAPLRRFY